MSAAQDVPLDERSFHDPLWLQEHGGLTSNTVLHYFALSPFQDPTSNNATLITQANYNPSLAQFIATREAFEAQLRNIAGLEFMVAFEPQETGQWVIRKQNRRKRRETEDAISILGTYFIINDTILTAPAVGDVIASRLLSTVSCLTGVLSTASRLPDFTPARGYTYPAPTPKALGTASGPQLSRTSQAATPMPDGPGQVEKTKTSAAVTVNRETARGVQSLLDSLRVTIRMGSEYMDENPLVGEPGSFILASTHGQSTAIAKLQPPQSTVKRPATRSPTLNSVVSATATTTGRKASKGSDKVPATSPADPKPKRRKSKAAINISQVSAT